MVYPWCVHQYKMRPDGAGPLELARGTKGHCTRHLEAALRRPPDSHSTTNAFGSSLRVTARGMGREPVGVSGGWNLDSSRRSKTGRSAGGVHLLPAVLEAVAVTFEADDLGVVDQPVDHGCDRDRVAEDLGPRFWGWDLFVVGNLGWCLRLWVFSGLFDS
jgi:hypothetical protein